MSIAAVRAVLRSASGLTRNDCVNTFYFDGGVGEYPLTDDVFDAVERFYTVDTSGGNQIGDYINDTILRADGLRLEYILSPETEPNGITDMRIASFPNVTTQNLPQEVAACLSFVDSDYTISVNPGRHRGRVYIGPLTTSAGADAGTSQPSRPTAAFQTQLAEAATRMKSEVLANDIQWCIWSRVDAVFRAVDSGWVDNEWDTQRRRGWDRTGRLFWF